MAEIGSETDTPNEDEELESLPPVGEMTLEEIEEDLDYLFHSHVGSTVMLTWLAAGAVAMFVLLSNKASTFDALLVFAAWLVSLFAVHIAARVAAIKLVTREPDAPFKYRYVWMFSLILNGPRGVQLVKLPHDRIEEMFVRRTELLASQNVAAYSPVSEASDRKWRLLGRFVLESVPRGLAMLLQSYYYFIWFVLVVLGLVGIVQLALYIRSEMMLG